MGGPGCSIPIRERLSEAQLEELVHWLHDVSDHGGTGRPIRVGTGDAWSFAVARADRLGFTGDLARARSFSLTLGENRTLDAISWFAGFTDWQGRYVDAYVLKEELAHEQRQWQDLLGYYPAQRLNLEAISNSGVDPRLLAHLALHLAERYEGLVDVGGPLTPPRARPPLRRNASPGEVRDWISSYPGPSLEEVHAFVQQLPGRVYAFTYAPLLCKGKGVRHVLDLTAFRAWMRHPNFHMPK